MVVWRSPAAIGHKVNFFWPLVHYCDNLVIVVGTVNIVIISVVYFCETCRFIYLQCNLFTRAL